MFIYLSKKIAIPNNTRLKCLAWNREQGFIACGGDDGLLKVLKLEAAKEGKARGLAAPSNLSANQTLEGHSGQIQVVTWNEVHQKLTSSDQYGLIVVWMAYKGAWYEEMINNRNKSVVRGMAWDSDGQKICIVYEDGAVIVGSVDGNRIWGKELKGCQLTGVVWSPEGKVLLFSMQSGEVHAYDSTGSFMSKLNIQCHVSSPGNPRVATMSWYDGRHGFMEPDCPVLSICYDNGRLQLMKNENDDVPVLLDTGLLACWCGWNHNGSVLAVAGQLAGSGTGGADEPPALASVPAATSEGAGSNVVQFYSPFGEHLRTLKVPGRQLSCCAWEGGSLRIALAVDSFIYFANVRPDYKWCSFGMSTLAYAFTRPDSAHPCVLFWDMDTNQRHTKQVRHLMAMAGAGEHCVLATRLDDGSGQFGLVLCNAIGTPVDSRFVDLEPLWLAATGSHVFAANHEAFLVWPFRTPRTRTVADAAAAVGVAHRKERDLRFHIDDVPSGLASDRLVDSGRRLQSSPQHKPTADPICALTAGEKSLVVGRESGLLHHYSLPQVTLMRRHQLACRPHLLAVNCNSTRVSVIDVTGTLVVVDLETSSRRDDGRVGVVAESPSMSSLERKDVWEMRWAEDNPDMLAVMEKTRMYVFQGCEPEEPVLSSGYVSGFRDLEIRAVLLDEILVSGHPEEPSPDVVLRLEAKALRDARDLLASVGLAETAAFIEEHPHPRLWRLLATAAFEQLDLRLAETAAVRCRDLPAIRLAKRLQTLVSNEVLRRAEVAAHLGRFQEAEELYLQADRRCCLGFWMVHLHVDLRLWIHEAWGSDLSAKKVLDALPRKDLALDLRRKLGDWFRVVQLLQGAEGISEGSKVESGTSTSPKKKGAAVSSVSSQGVDPELEEAWSNLGDYFADRHSWENAREYYEKARKLDELARCCYVLEDYRGMEAVLKALPDNHSLLPWLGDTFASVGLCQQAVQAYTKCGRFKAAVDTCVTLNQWRRAVELAHEHRLAEIGGLLDRYARHLLADPDKLSQAVELYRKASHFLEASQLLYQLAEREARKKSPPMRVKKLYVLAALMMEEHRKKPSGDDAVATKGPSARKIPPLPAASFASTSSSALDPSTAAAIDAMTTLDSVSNLRDVDNPWHGAEAYHFYMLAQRQLYNGLVDAATKTAMQLRRYEDVLDMEDMYCLLALCSCASRSFGTCSRAMVRLEALGESIPFARQKAYEELAVDIFSKRAPKDLRPSRFECTSCETLVPDWLPSCPGCGASFPLCVATGRPLPDPAALWTCHLCHHHAAQHDMAARRTCPLCHAPV